VRHAAGRKRRDSRLLVAVALVLSAAVIWQASYSAFAVTASNPGNSWKTGQMSLSTTATALFSSAGNAAAMKPGFSLDRCLTVSYTGNVAASGAVRLYATGPLSDTSLGGRLLGDYLSVTVDEWNGASDAACTTFPGAGYQNVVNGVSMTTFGTKTTYAAGYPGVWTPAAAASSRTYRIRIAFPGSAVFPGGGSNAVDTDLMDLDASVAFTWEVQS
jgi:hypothetical protein